MNLLRPVCGRRLRGRLGTLYLVAGRGAEVVLLGTPEGGRLQRPGVQLKQNNT